MISALLAAIFIVWAQTMASSARLVNQRVLVTGAGRGIGRAIALICEKEGAKVHVAICSRSKPELDETASMAANAANIMCCVSDVTNAEQVEDMVKSVVERYGGIDVLVNNAGGSQAAKGSLETLPSEDLLRLLNLNVVGVHTVTSAVLRHAMLPAKTGRIVNISSRAGKVGLPGMGFYCASKFALEGLSATLAEEVKDKGIECNTLSPGMVNTKSFPKPDGKKGVRSAESVEDSLFVLLESGVTGQYIHADELDDSRAKGLDDTAALKPISEAIYSP